MDYRSSRSLLVNLLTLRVSLHCRKSTGSPSSNDGCLVVQAKGSARVRSNTVAKANVYPGESSSAPELVALADEFRRSSELIAKSMKARKANSTAPFRLLCIHAIELYLNAYLRNAGQPAPTIRGMQHNLAARLELTDASGLILRQKTRMHLTAISANREYVASRYEPAAVTLSQVNRLQATLEEVRNKVLKQLARPKPAEARAAVANEADA